MSVPRRDRATPTFGSPKPGTPPTSSRICARAVMPAVYAYDRAVRRLGDHAGTPSRRQGRNVAERVQVDHGVAAEYAVEQESGRRQSRRSQRRVYSGDPPGTPIVEPRRASIARTVGPEHVVIAGDERQFRDE